MYILCDYYIGKIGYLLTNNINFISLILSFLLRPLDEIDSIYCDLLHYLHNFLLYLSKTPSFNNIIQIFMRIAININVKLETKSSKLYTEW